MDTYKKVVQLRQKSYHPAAAVRSIGDLWRHDAAVAGLSIQTQCALRASGPDAMDAATMSLLEKGLLPRIAAEDLA